jgi:hypothetical protein
MKGETMKHRHNVLSLLLVAGFLAVVTLLPSPALCAGTPYNPSQFYKGTNISYWLYYRNAGDRGTWIRGGFEGGYFPETVKCPEALQRLKKYGFWQGRMRDDGSCGEDAPLRDWAVGNWLNYTISNGSR